MSGGVSHGHNLQNSMPYMDNLTLVASAARTASDTTTVRGLAPYTSAYFMLDVTVAATEAGDKLAVFIQREMPNGDWMDIVSFAEVLGNGGAKKYRADVYPGATGGETGNPRPPRAGRRPLGRLRMRRRGESVVGKISQIKINKMVIL